VVKQLPKSLEATKAPKIPSLKNKDVQPKIKATTDAAKKQNKLKLDQGFKSLLRGSRKAFKSAFEKSDLDTGKHHWTEEKWFS
jgi:hypothetical protein